MVGEDAPVAVVVVNFLAVLELCKRSLVTLSQDHQFGEIHIAFIEGSREEDAFDPERKE